MKSTDVENILFEEYAKYRTSMLEFQEQHRLIFGIENKSCETIMSNVKYFFDLIIKRLNSECKK